MLLSLNILALFPVNGAVNSTHKLKSLCLVLFRLKVLLILPKNWWPGVLGSVVIQYQGYLSNIGMRNLKNGVLTVGRFVILHGKAALSRISK